MEQSRRLLRIANEQGFIDLLDILNEHIEVRTNSILNLISRTPEKLTGKTAMAAACGKAALEEFKEDVLGRIEAAKKESTTHRAGL